MNYYVIILLLVVLAGIGVAWWGWKILANSRKRSQWPTVKGEIISSEANKDNYDPQLNIQYRYDVEGNEYTGRYELPNDVDLLPELVESKLNKFPLGQIVEVFYNPLKPEDASLEPGLQGDWLILALGIILILMGIVMFFL